MAYTFQSGPLSGPGSAIYANQQAKGLVRPDGSTAAGDYYKANPITKPWVYGQPNTGWGNDFGQNAGAQWDQWAKTMQNQYGTGQGGTLGGTSGGNVTPPGAGRADPYGAGYTGYGATSLSASGNPDYNGQHPGGSGSNSGPPPNSGNPPPGGYYAGQPQSGLAPTPIANYTRTGSYGGPVAPLMPNLNTTIAPPPTRTTSGFSPTMPTGTRRG